MSKRNLADKVKLTTYQDMFGIEDGVYEGKDNEIVDKIIDVPLTDLYTFKNHPFRVLDDEKMTETVESIKQYGVLVPGIARVRPEGGYEIISGHRRKMASELAGLETMPMMIRTLSDDEAVIIMVDSNIQREELLPSEKAKAYAMKFEAIKHQGKSGGGLTIQKMGEESGDSAKTVQRYIQLSKLEEGLLTFVDEKRLGFGQGVDFSYIDKDAQEMVYKVMNETKCAVSGVQSARIKDIYKEGMLTMDKICEILNQKKEPKRKIVFDSKRLDSYFTPNYSSAEIEQVIFQLLDEWKLKEGGNR